MSVLPPPPPDASPDVPGLVHNRADEQAFAGPKRFVNDPKVDDTLTVGAASPVHTVEVDGDEFDIEILPLQIGGFGEDADLSDLFEVPGVRRYGFPGQPATFLVGKLNGEFDGLDYEGLGFEFEEGSGEAAFLGERLFVNKLGTSEFTAAQVQAGTIDVNQLYVGGVPIVPGSSGVNTVGAFGTAPNSGGASVSGSTLTLQPADASNPGGVSVGDQQLGGSSSTKTFGNILVTSLATIAAAVTSLVRAVGAALVLRSDVGALSTDVAVKVGTSVADGSTHASAKLLAGYTGLGGTEVQKFFIDKSGTLDLAGALYFNRSLVDKGTSGFPTQLIGTNQGFLVDTTAAVSGTAKLFLFRTFGDNKAWVTGRGTYGVAGTMGSVVGDQTINAAKGRAILAAGLNSMTITNDQVTASSVVVVVWETDGPFDSAVGKLCGHVVEPTSGSFLLRLVNEDGTTPTALANYAFRFVVIQ